MNFESGTKLKDIDMENKLIQYAGMQLLLAKIM
jgi:hypothetical protein